MRRFFTGLAVLILGLGCFSSGGSVPYSELPVERDVEVDLSDAIFLETVGPDTIYGTDSGAAYDVQPEPGYLDLYDVSNQENPDISEATEIPEPCEKGYVRVNGDCVFAAQCDRIGLTSLPLSIPYYPGEFIKVEAVVSPSKPSCSQAQCSQTEPCCQSCYATLKAGNVVLVGNGFAIGCMGTNCDYQEKCSPMVAGKSYIFWGSLYKVQNYLEIVVDGFCESP